MPVSLSSMLTSGMNIVGAILESYRPNEWYILVEYSSSQVVACVIAGEYVDGRQRVGQQEDFRRVVNVSEFKRTNPEGWRAFWEAYPEIARDIDVGEPTQPIDSKT